MNVASLELCRTLFELSGWGDCYMVYGRSNEYKPMQCKPNYSVAKVVNFVRHTPAYDLGYLLRKLPRYLPDNGWDLMMHCRGEEAVAFYYELDAFHRLYEVEADTPEDAACKLSIILFKQGVLTPTQEKK